MLPSIQGKIMSNTGRAKEGRWRREREEHRRREDQYKHKKSLEKNSSMFFFSNFPDSHAEYEMFRVFQKWSRVREVFISKRPNRWGRRFGFVRFYPVQNELQLEQQLDQIRIGNLNLFVNLPKYRRVEAIQKNVGHRKHNSMAK